MNASDLKIGLLLPSWTGGLDGLTPSARDVIDIAQLAEQVGFDTVWMSDHFYYEPYVDYRIVGVEFPPDYAGIKVGAWECWALMAAMAIATTRIELGTLVSNTGLRNPALFSRMVDTVDDLSNGRIILGLGAGDFVTEHQAFGFPFERRVGRFEEALAIIKPLLRGERVTYQGEFYQTEGAQLLPKGARTAGPPLMIGTLRGGPRMTRLVAQHADLWNCILAFGDCSPATFLAAWEPVHAACLKHGRDPMSLLRHVTVGVNMSGAAFPVPGALPFTGSVAQIAERISQYAALDVQQVSIVLQPSTRAGIEQFAAVIAALKR